MTMEATQSEVEKISSELFKNEKLVTYHTLSRSLGIHTNYAKTLLEEFYSKNRERLSASFIITGKSEKGVLIKISKDESKLEEDMKVFQSISTIHVYCLTLQTSEFTTQEIAFEELQHPLVYEKVQDYYKNGMIRGANVKEVVAVPKVPVPTKSRPAVAATPAPANNSKPKVMRLSGISSSYVSRKNQPSKSTTPISNYVPRKTAKRHSDESTGYQYKSRKLEKEEPKERVVISSNADEENNDEGPIEETSTGRSSAKTGDLAKMFDDLGNFSDFGDDETEDKPQESQEEIEVSETVADENNESEKDSTPMFIPEDDEEEEGREDNRKPHLNTMDSPEEVETKPDTVDEDGFVISYRKSKPGANSKPETKIPVKRATKAKTLAKTQPTKADGKKKQSSLMNFFSAK